MKSQNSINNYTWLKSELLIPLLVIFIYGLGYFYFSHIVFPVVYVFVAITLTLIAVFLFKEKLLLLLCFSIPLTIPLSIGGGSTINFPSESICIILALYFMIKAFIDHKFDREFICNAITLFIFLDLLWLIFTSSTSSMPLVSFKRVAVRVVYVVVYFFMFYELYKADKHNINKVFLLYCLGLIIPIIYTTINHSRFQFSSKGATTASLPFYNDHTLFGAVLAFFIPYLYYQTFIIKHKFSQRLFFFFLLLCFLITLFLSYSRAAWVTVLIAAGIYILLKLKVRKRFMLFSLAIIVIVGLGMKDSISNYLIKNRETSHKNDVSKHFKSIANVQTDVSNAERVNRWKCAYRMFLDKPLLGFGPGTYQFNYGRYQQRKDLTVISTFSGNKGHAHSEYLNYLSETGFPGCFIFLMLIGTIAYKAIKLIYNTTDAFIRDTTTFLFLGLCTFFIHSIFNGFIETDKMAMLVFTSISAIVFLNSINNKSEQVI